MDGFYNVKTDFGAVGDGCANDTLAIQTAVNALARPNATPTLCALTGRTEAWAPYRSGLYFPAGVYRIEGPITMPFMHEVRLFGDGGRGGAFQGDVPSGSILRQDTANAPIFRFDKGDSWGVTIERLGFTWREQQERPPGWALRDDAKAPLAPGYTTPGAVAILFSAGGRSVPDDDYYHFRITDCLFEKGWRGVSIDETYTAGHIAVWNSQIDHCLFGYFRGRRSRS